MFDILKYKLLYVLIAFVFSFSYSYCQKINASVYGMGSDPTAALLSALKSDFDTIVIDKQSEDWVIKPIVVNGLKNKVILVEEGVEIRAKVGAFLETTDALFNFANCQSIKIYGHGNKICMNKSEYTDGEWRHGISLRKCKNVSINHLRIYDTGGDGIYISGIEKGSFSENIKVENVTCVNNKRQGMSIISAKDVTVRNCVFRDTYGTLPGAGLDIEPNSKLDRIENIKFYDCTFKDNDHAGILLALHNLQIDSKPVHVEFNNCIIENNHSETNKYAASELIFDAHKTNPVKGNVYFNNCTVRNSKWGLFYSRKVAESFTVTFNNCQALNICKNATYPAIYLEVPDYYKGNYTLGGYVFNNLKLEYDSDVAYLMVRGSTLQTLDKVSDINGEISVKSLYRLKTEYINYDNARNANFDISVKHLTLK